MCGDSRDNELTPHPIEDDGDEWDFAVVPVYSQVDGSAILRRDLDVIRELCCLASLDVPENASSVFSFALQSLNGITERNPAVADKEDGLEHVRIVEETAAVSLDCLGLMKII